MVAEHTVKAFDEDITHLRGLIAEMGGLAELAISESMEALVKGSAELAAQVITRDKRIDAIEAEVDRLVVRTIALRAPMADDLRDVIAGLKIAGILERIGDYAKNIAKRVTRIEGRVAFEPLTLIPAMAEIAGEMVHDVLDAYAARNPQAAQDVMERDAKVDAFYDSIFRNMVSFMVENPSTITSAAHLLFVARNLERIGDHTTNIAEQVYFAATAEYMGDRVERPEN
ncbi:MAG TPA: phosphate signaling complex protein PhoU [Novosphingobium sp.]|nr:phosphate signaling complex protein PhoU [Novosphingobium sp.]